VATEEARLVRRCLKGDADAIRTLVDEFHVAVYGLCVRLLTNRHDAEDVTQEVFLRVFRSLRRWDPARPLKPWIMGITVNRCRTWIMQRARRPELADYLHDVAVSPIKDDASELLHEIHQALTALRPEFREVFVLFHEHGQSYEQIADAVGCPIGTVKTWLHRARLEVLEQLRTRGMVDDANQSDESPAASRPKAR
jgi:RNA polymerase sigma-70 factor (ECF subfamily)